MKQFKLWDKKKEELLGPFTLNDIEAVSIDSRIFQSAIVTEDWVILLKDIESRYLQIDKSKTKEDFK